MENAIKASELPDLGSAQDEPLSFNEAVDALGDFGDDLDDDQGPAPAEGANDSGQQEAPDDDAGDTKDASAKDDEAQPEADDAASDDDVVELADGTKKPLSEVLEVYSKYEERVKGFQREYTQKFEEAARLKDEAEQQSERVLKWAEETRSLRENLLSLKEQFVGTRPTAEMAMEDPLQYQIEEARWRERSEAFESHIQQRQAEAEHERVQNEQKRQKAAYDEWQETLKLYPDLAEQSRQEEVVQKLGQYYGLEPDAVANVTSPKLVSIIMDAIKHREAKVSAEKIESTMAAKPRVIRGAKSKAGSRPATPGSKAAERLKRTGSLDDAVTALMDFDD